MCFSKGGVYFMVCRNEEYNNTVPTLLFFFSFKIRNFKNDFSI